MHVLLALAVIIVVARTMGMLFKRFKQPPVIGEVIAGILLGPSLSDDWRRKHPRSCFLRVWRPI